MKKSAIVMLALVTALAVLVFVAVGCGGGATTTTAGATDTSGNTETTAPGSSETTAPATGGEDIPIGFLTSYTGELGAYGEPYTNAATMAIDDINAAGGVMGRKLVMFTQDDQSAPEQAIKAARTLIGVNNVPVICGMNSDGLVAVYPVAKENKVFVTSQSAGTTRMDTDHGDWFFRTVPSDSFDGEVAARVLLEKGFKDIAMIYENDESRQSIANAMAAAFEAGGGNIDAQVAFTPRQPTYSAELKKVADSNPQVVWLGSGQESGSVLLKNAKQAGYSWQWMVSSDLAVPEMFGLVGNDVMEGILSETPSADTTIDYVMAWNDRFTQRFNKEATGGFQANSYDQITIVALAWQKAGTVSGEAIAQNYHAVTDENPNAVVVHTYADGLAALQAGQEIKYEGVSGPCVFDANGNTVGSYTSLVAKNGSWEVETFYPASDFVK